MSLTVNRNHSPPLNKPTQNHQPILSARHKVITAVAIIALLSAAVYYLRPQSSYDPYCSPEFCKENPHFNAAMLKRGEGPCICLEWMNGYS